MLAQQPQNGKQIVFSESSYFKIGQILAEILKRTQARLCIFVDINGYPIVNRGEIPGLELSSFTALAAGDFAATSEMARMIAKESRFKYLFHEGAARSIYSCSVGDEYFLMVIFDKGVALGMIRVIAHYAADKIAMLVDELKKENEQAKQILDMEFSDLLTRQLDKTFGLK